MANIGINRRAFPHLRVCVTSILFIALFQRHTRFLISFGCGLGLFWLNLRFIALFQRHTRFLIYPFGYQYVSKCCVRVRARCVYCVCV